MTLGHFLYIPGVLCLGLLIGWVLGSRAAEVARADREADVKRRAARDRARAEDASREPPADNPPAP